MACENQIIVLISSIPIFKHEIREWFFELGGYGVIKKYLTGILINPARLNKGYTKKIGGKKFLGNLFKPGKIGCRLIT